MDFYIKGQTMKTPIFALVTSLLLFASTSLEAKDGKDEADSQIKDCISGNAIPKNDIPRCVGLIYASGISGLKYETSKSDKESKDKAYKCVKESPANLDWDFCKSSLTLYNGLVIAEGAMSIATQLKTNSNNKNIQESVNQKALTGSIQTAAIEGQKEKLESDAKILTSQMTFYGGQAALLTTQITSWPGSVDRVKSLCEKRFTAASAEINRRLGELKVSNPDGKLNQIKVGKSVFTVAPKPNEATTEMPVVAPPATLASCSEIITEVLTEDELLPNKSAKGVVTAKALEATGKAAAAGIDASKARAAAKQLEQVAGQLNNTDNSSPAIIELCRVEPTNPRCMASGARTNISSYQPGQFNMDGGGGGQAFNPNPEATDGVLGNEGVATDGKTIADITSPFSDEADKASKMLDQAGGAAYGPGGGSAGGGVGGGGGGGGSASLGSDLKGADKDNKEAEIDVKKTVASYGGGGGGGAGYKAMGGSDKDENPLQSLFDGEGAKGGIEEDRSIASEGIDDKNSALFEKISKKYEKVAGEKRIEASNVE